MLTFKYIALENFIHAIEVKGCVLLQMADPARSHSGHICPNVYVCTWGPDLSDVCCDL